MKKQIVSALLALGLMLALCPAAAAAQEAAPVRIGVIDTGISSVSIAAENLAEGKNYIRPQDDTQDKVGHGTAVAGIIVGSETAGVTGICPEAVLVPLVWCSKDENGNTVKGRTDMAAQAIYDAVDTYACDMINLSSGAVTDTESLRRAVAYAEKRGVLVVSSAGNDGQTAPARVYYPGGYETVLCVGSADGEGRVSAFSQSNDTVDLIAPGEGLRVASIRGKLIRASGTSFSTAYVSGAAARLLTERPSLTPAQLREILCETARDLGAAGWDADSGWGMVDLSAALEKLFVTPSMPFVDLPEDAYYRDAVSWALEEGVTTGTSDTTFSPNETCTRAQVVTFLWRALGCPEPIAATTSFEDVPKNKYYSSAVLWAVEEGITTGVTDTSFAPHADCTEAQIVTFLWRALGCPDAAGESLLAAGLGEHYYTAAAVWADTYGLFLSAQTDFLADTPSPRAHIVTYLYRSVAVK